MRFEIFKKELTRMFIKPQAKELRKDPPKDAVLDRIIQCTSFKLRDREILGRPIGEPTYSLGRYTTPHRAKQVFEELEKAIEAGHSLFKMPLE